MMQAAVDDAVAEASQPAAAELLLCPGDQSRQQLAWRRRLLRAYLWRCDRLAVGPGGTCSGVRPDPVHLSREKPLFALVKAELQRRRTGVDYADQRLCGGCHAGRVLQPRMLKCG